MIGHLTRITKLHLHPRSHSAEPACPLAWEVVSRVIPLALLLIAALALPGCLAMNFVPAGGPVDTIPQGVTQVQFPSTEGVTINAWLFPPRDTDATRALDPAPSTASPKTGHAIVFCHGVTDSVDTNMAWFLTQAGFRVLSFDYRDFGSSTHADKSNLGFADDACAAVAFARALPDVDPNRVIVVGHSMGGVYALAAASRAAQAGQPLAGVVSASAFSHWRSISNHHVPVWGLLGGGVWGPEPTVWAARLAKTPLLITHASRDDAVPSTHALALAEAAITAGTPTEIYMPPYGGHVAFYLPTPPPGQDDDDILLGRGAHLGAEHIIAWIRTRLLQTLPR